MQCSKRVVLFRCPDHEFLSFYSFLHQQTSWSVLETSTKALQQLLIAYSVSSIFLEALYSFGTKVTGDDDPYYAHCEERHNTSLNICGELARPKSV